jgi:predicted acyltransferase
MIKSNIKSLESNGTYRGAQLPVGGQAYLNGSAAMEGGTGVAKTADSVTPFAAVEAGATLRPPTLNCAPYRVRSVDFFRGFTMFLLAGEASGLYVCFLKSEYWIFQSLGTQFTHHDWHGFHLWDLIQPFFMFIAGVAVPFAVANRSNKGESMKTITLHALKRSGLLLFLGWAIYFVAAGRLVFRFQNVLAQLSVSYMIAFLVINRSFFFKVIFTLIILLLMDLAYRFFPVDGFDDPWVRFHNLGAWVNLQIEGVANRTSWATLNVISTTAYTVWGLLCGQLLMSDKLAKEKILILTIAGFSALIAGYSLDLLCITPLIKKIATASFVFASGGWTILAFIFCYWLIDVMKLFSKGAEFFLVVGRSSLLIYLFCEFKGAALLSNIARPFSKLIFSWGGELAVATITSLIVCAAMWYMCYWIYENKF